MKKFLVTSLALIILAGWFVIGILDNMPETPENGPGPEINSEFTLEKLQKSMETGGVVTELSQRSSILYTVNMKGKVEEISGKVLTITWGNDTQSVYIRESVMIATRAKEVSFKEIKVGDTVAINTDFVVSDSLLVVFAVMILN